MSQRIMMDSHFIFSNFTRQICSDWLIVLSERKIRLPICRRWLIFKHNRHFHIKQGSEAAYKDSNVPSKSTNGFVPWWTYQTPSSEAPSPPPPFSFGFLPPPVCPPERKQRKSRDYLRIIARWAPLKMQKPIPHTAGAPLKITVLFKCYWYLTENSL